MEKPLKTRFPTVLPQLIYTLHTIFQQLYHSSKQQLTTSTLRLLRLFAYENQLINQKILEYILILD